MAQVRVYILDPSNTTRTQVEVPDNVPVTHLVRALAQKMGLPTVDRSGEPIQYRLAASRNGEDLELGDQTLAEAAIHPDDRLRLYAEMTAGGGFRPMLEATLDHHIEQEDLATCLAARADRLRERVAVVEHISQSALDLRVPVLTVVIATILFVIACAVTLAPYVGILSDRVSRASLTVLSDVFAYLVVGAAYWVHRSWKILMVVSARKRSIQYALQAAYAAGERAYATLRDLDSLPPAIALREVPRSE